MEKFLPIQRAIKLGDLPAFKASLGPESGNQEWFFDKGLLLPLLYRGEILVWRSLARRTFLLTYQSPTDATSKKAPTLNLNDLVASAMYCQHILEGYTRAADQGGNSLFVHSNDLFLPHNGPKTLSVEEGVIYANTAPDLHEIEAIVASLVQQGLMRGLVSHNLSVFAIMGSKQRGGPLNAGFPAPYEVMKNRGQREGGDVPGWVKSERKAPMGGVVNLSGIARAVGSGA